MMSTANDSAKAGELDRALLEKPDNVELLLERAQLFRRNKKLEQAFSDVQRILRIQPQSEIAAEMARQLLAELTEKLDISKAKMTPGALLKTVLGGSSEKLDPKELVSSANQLQQLASNPAVARHLLANDALTSVFGILLRQKPISVMLDTDAEQAYRQSLAKLVWRIVSTVSNDQELRQAIGFFAAANLKDFSTLFQRDHDAAPVMIETVVELYSKCALFLEDASDTSLRGTLETFVFALLDGVTHSNDSRGIQLALIGINKMMPSKTLARHFMDSRLFHVIKAASMAQDGRSLISLLLSTLWQSLTSQEDTEKLIQAVGKSYTQLFDSDDKQNRHMALHVLGALFQISPDFGSPVLTSEGLLDNMMDCVDYEDEDIQAWTLETLSNACSDKKCRSRIQDSCSDYLKQMLNSEEDRLKNGAAVILTKLSNTKPDPLLSSAMQQQNQTMEPAVKDDVLLDMLLKQLVNHKESDANSLANTFEGLTYLSTKPNAKELICRNPTAVQNLFQACKRTESKTMMYGISSILLNLVSYRRRLTEEEKNIQKLREFAKEAHESRNDPLDDDAAVEARIGILVQAGLIPAAVILGKSESENVKMNVSMILLSCATPKTYRGLMVQQGAVRTLLNLTQNIPTKFHFVPITNAPPNTTMLAACQTLAKMAITLDPNIAFRNTASSLVRPFAYLAQSESELHQFEAMMALTNLASMDDGQNLGKNSIQARIIQGQGLRAMEHCLFSDNFRIRCAATEGICNMMMTPDVIELYSESPASENKLRMLIALCDEDDFATRRAASGALAMLSASPKACEKIATEKLGLEVVLKLLGAEEPELVHRAVVLVLNLTKVKQIIPDLVKHEGRAVKSLRTLTKSQNPAIAEAAIQALLNISSRDD